MYGEDALVRDNLIEAHQSSWTAIGQPGAFWSGRERVQMVAQARAVGACKLCRERKAALSPFAVSGRHDPVAEAHDLPDVVVDAIHRIISDPGRMTRSVFEGVLAAGVSAEAYIEMVSVINSSVIIDTLHRSLGFPVPALPAVEAGEPSGERNPDAVDGGAWVPILDASPEGTITGMPAVPNIVRAMGLVPGAVQLFFQTFRPHYALLNIPLAISQAQAEFVASRVSALNECFY